jgi:hypothetical protein
MGTALTYARRYALFTLVGIAGEDDLDAPDLNGGLEGTLPLASNSDDSGQRTALVSGDKAPESRSATAHSATTAYPARRKPVRPPRIILAPQKSLELRELLLTELARFTETEALTAWAGRILPQKNQLTTSDAEALEVAFAAKLSELGGDAAAENENVEMSKRSESASDKLNHEGDLWRGAKRTNGSPSVGMSQTCRFCCKSLFKVRNVKVRNENLKSR